MADKQNFRLLVKGKPKKPSHLSDAELAAEILRVAILTASGCGQPLAPERVSALLEQFPHMELQTGCDVIALAKEAVKPGRGDLIIQIVGKKFYFYQESYRSEFHPGTGIPRTPVKEHEFARSLWNEFDEGRHTVAYKRTFGDIFPGSPNTTAKRMIGFWAAPQPS
jgi:hypothetical protein